MRIILTAALMFMWTMQAPAQERVEGIEATIQNQIEAFKVDDFETAFSFASPNIKRLFGTSNRFGQMVQKGYPMVWRPSRVEFLELRRQGPFTLQKVLFVDAQGAPHVLEYNMINTPQGWQIDGVQYLVAPPVGA